MPPKPEPDGPETPKTFWTTLPGVLTGAAAMLTAVGALVAALGAAGLFGLPRGPATPGGPAPQPAPPAAISTSGDASPVVIGVDGDVTIRSGE